MKYLILPFLICFGHLVWGQQDPLFSQYQFNQLPMNPGYAGYHGVTSFDVQHRSQWTKVDGAPSTLMLSGHSSFFENQIGLGAVLIHDKIGINTTTNFNLTYAYHLNLSESTQLSFGLQTGFNSLQYDFEQLTLEDQTDVDFAGTGDGFTKLNIGTGLFLHNENFYLGFSVPRMLKVKEDLGENTGDRYNQHFYLNGGAIIKLADDNVLKPYVIARGTKGASLSTDIGISALFDGLIWGGLFTRSFSAYGFTAFLNISDTFRFGYAGELYSNDVTTGLSTHEISLGIDLKLFDNQTIEKRYY